MAGMEAEGTGAGGPLRASVLIASRGRPAMLADLVRSVLGARRVPAQIVIVDQSDTPQRELESLAGPGGCTIRYVHAPEAAGLSRARNLALREATEDVVVILDDDMLAQEESLERLLAGRDGHGARTVTTGRLLAAPPERPGLSQPPGALVLRTEPAVYRGRQPMQVVPGPNVAIPRAVMVEIGGYDERLGAGTRFPSAEDHDLSLRLLDARWSTTASGTWRTSHPEAVVLHRAWRARRDVVRLRWGYARGVGGFYAKHAGIRDRHTLERACQEIGRRARRALTSIPGSPRTVVRELLTIAGLVVGALEWTVRYRLGRRRGPAV